MFCHETHSRAQHTFTVNLEPERYFSCCCVELSDLEYITRLLDTTFDRKELEFFEDALRIKLQLHAVNNLGSFLIVHLVGSPTTL
jgi:hypothetical protein